MKKIDKAIQLVQLMRTQEVDNYRFHPADLARKSRIAALDYLIAAMEDIKEGKA